MIRALARMAASVFYGFAVVFFVLVMLYLVRQAWLYALYAAAGSAALAVAGWLSFRASGGGGRRAEADRR